MRGNQTESMSEDKRLIEDYLPIQEISAEASREKNVRKGHISTLHLWWARRPLVACRAAVYGALVPASQFVGNGHSDKKNSTGRKKAKKFLTDLCEYPGSSSVITQAKQHLLKAHAERLTREMREWRSESTQKPSWIEEFKFNGDHVTVEDIEADRAPRPRVLDMFAGGGAIPLEALRLGCEAYALDLNPVAHIIEICTLVYPQKFGGPDPNAKGMTGPKDSKGKTTWGGLASEVRYWGGWVLERVRGEIGKFYPLIPDPKTNKEALVEDVQRLLIEKDAQQKLAIPGGYLTPVAYLWTRTVTCKNPNCRAIVPLVKQTWLCKKPRRYVALKMIAPRDKKVVRFEVVEAQSESELGFDPTAFSLGGNATCPFCGTVADSEYVKAEGRADRMRHQFMGLAATRPGAPGKVYFDESHLEKSLLPDEEAIQRELDELIKARDLLPLKETIEVNPRSMDIDRAGLTQWKQLFTTRQQLALMSFSSAVRTIQTEMQSQGYSDDRQKAVQTLLGCAVSKLADFCSTLCVFNYTGGRGVKNSFPQQSIPMVWDFAETNVFNPAGASWIAVIEDIPAVLERLKEIRQVGIVQRASATSLPSQSNSMDAVITDPPYYDNVSYSNLSDFFLLWLRRSIGHLYTEHFALPNTPKKQEIIAAAYRHNGNRNEAKVFYESQMQRAFAEAARVLKSDGQLAVVYAHKTTLGWATLVDALRRGGFVVTEAWPVDTERKGRVIAMDTAALASSIFLVARKRDGVTVGNYEEQVKGELEQIVRERVETLWAMGISGADLVIACVGAGLRAFTRFAKVEYANGDEVPAEKFLTEVETVVLESVLDRLSKEIGDRSAGLDRHYNLAGLDAATRFYVLWRYTYKVAELDAGEAIIFANGTHIELDGQRGLSSGARALVEKKKSKYRLRDFAERGHREDLGLADAGINGGSPLIDVLHRILWLMENEPRKLSGFLEQALPDRERLRQLAQVLGGPALRGGETDGQLINTTSAESSALGKLLANWKALIDARLEEFRLR